MYLLKLVHNNYLFFFFWILLNKTNNVHVVVYHCPLYIHTSFMYSCMIGSFKEAITFESVERSLRCDHSNETYIVFGSVQCTCLFFSIIITFFGGGRVNFDLGHFWEWCKNQKTEEHLITSYKLKFHFFFITWTKNCFTNASLSKNLIPNKMSWSEALKNGPCEELLFKNWCKNME